MIQHLNAFNVVLLAVALYATWLVLEVLKVAFNRDLSKVPGPFWSRFTNLSLKLAILSGNRSVYIHSLHEKYGPFVRIAPQEIAIADIDAWRKIHRIGSDFGKGPWYQGQTPRQYNDETCGVFGIRNNKTASHRRRLFQTAGTKKIVAEWEPQIKELTDLVVTKMKQELSADGKTDVVKWWTLMTSDVLGDVAFGESYNNVKSGRKSELVRDIEEAMPFIGIRMNIPFAAPLLEIMPPSWYGQAEPIWDRFTKYGRKALENTHAAIKGGNKTLFSKMVPEDGSGQVVPDLVVEQEAANIIVAGTDTTAMALVYLTFHVLKNRDIHNRLVQELQGCSASPNWAELENMHYLNNVILETLRLCPPVPASLTRNVPQGGEDLGMYALPAGTLVGTQAWTFHRDPSVFSDPLEFDPDRWHSPTPEMKEHFMPFGGPVRICLGQNIARLEMLHAVSRFFRECPNVMLGPNTTDESMQVVDFFTVKPKSGVCEIIAT